jgi:hypothetical protein
MGRPSKNEFEMTGQELDGKHIGKRTFAPWADMKVGDWFTPVADAYAMASRRNTQNPDRQYAGVQVRGLNCVVRVK